MNKALAGELSVSPRVRETLTRLASAPPQVLLIEGATEAGRLAFAYYWAMAANCPRAIKSRGDGGAGEPCGECPTCLQVAANEFPDMTVYDGRIGNKQDEEKPGPIRALSVDNARGLKSANAEAPRGGGKRVAIIQGMSRSREEALNCLLKTLEEPSETTLFVLLAAQREQILPTLVSRSLCVTLPWTTGASEDADLADWAAAMARFLASGTGLLEMFAAKGALDVTLAARLVTLAQKALTRALGGEGDDVLAKAFAPLAATPLKAAQTSAWLSEAGEALGFNASPARILEALFAKLFALTRS